MAANSSRKRYGMDQRQLFNLKQLIRAARRGDGGLTMEEIEDLQQAVNTELYAQRIKDFKQYVDKSIPYDMPNATPAQQADFEHAMEKFYNMEWVICFGTAQVIINNEATIYNGMLDVLSELIDYCL